MKELARINRWANGPDPLLVFEAIGGMGKSMVTHHWMDQLSPTAGPVWAGRMWYSFYEDGASMNDFCVHALAYIEQQPISAFSGQKTAALTPRLLTQLKAKPWLFVMDGLERVLVAYHRIDKAQMRDEDVDHDPNQQGRDPNHCVRPADEHLLRALAAAKPSKLLVSTRNMPTALINVSKKPIPGVDHDALTGLEPDDAERLMNDAGVTGTSWRLRDYLEKHFECHPLMVGVVAGLVKTHLTVSGDFDAWLEDPQGAVAVDLTRLEGLVAKREHILRRAFDQLDPQAKRLLGVLAFFSQGVAGNVLVDLNPLKPPRPETVEKPRAARF